MQTNKERIQEALGLKGLWRPAFLAPMAGYSDLPYRIICHQEHCRLGTTELVSSTGIRHSGLKKSWRYLAVDPEAEGPVLIQLFGHSAEDFRIAAEAILEEPLLARCSGLDINMGCPVPKVVKTGAGSALLERPETAVAIVRTLRTLLPRDRYLLGAKIRLGFSGQNEQSHLIAPQLVAEGVDILTVHGRFREQYYAGRADWAAIGRVENALCAAGVRDDVLLVGNGDLNSVESVDRCMAESLVDAVAIGRAAQGNPWFFRQLALGEENAKNILPVPDLAEKAEGIRTHLVALCNFIGEALALKEFRKTLAAYASGHPQARRLRELGSGLNSPADFAVWLERFMNTAYPEI